MNKLSKEKRDQLILVVLVTIVVLSCLWFGLIKIQQAKLQVIAAKKEALQHKLHDMENAVKGAQQIGADLAKAGATLREQEENMASGDLYGWMTTTIREFRLPYKVEIANYTDYLRGDMTMFPSYPYKQITMRLSGSAYYHDLGQFVSDFENRFPHARIQNLSLQPMSGLISTDPQKLGFEFDVIALEKSGRP